jgi:PHD/YefM family antitoxin component YafN of YafNO toxin-antitoxin module
MTTTLTIAEIKRRGMAAIEEALEAGPVHIIKRNRRAAVVLSEEAYSELLRRSANAPEGLTAVQWLLTHSGNGARAREAIDADLPGERDW